MSPAYWIQGVLILFLASWWTPGCGRLHHAASHPTGNCTFMKAALTTKGIPIHDATLPNKFISGEMLQVCTSNWSCCSVEVESHLEEHSRSEFDLTIGDRLGHYRQIFIVRTAKFDAYFINLLNQSKHNLHEMFLRTYGLLYQQNAQMFADLFRDLRSYYKGTDLSLTDALDNFFSNLLQRMFVLINENYAFDSVYLNCFTEYIDQLKPFGEVPSKLARLVKRSFVVARTFVQGLAVGRDVIQAIAKLDASDACYDSVTRILYCPYCHGLVNIRPCPDHCVRVFKSCLEHYGDINSAWNAYLDVLLKVAGRLEGPFNIETVVEPLDVKISDAIMTFQENAESIKNKVFKGCGQPPRSLQRRRRKKESEGESLSMSTTPIPGQSWRKHLTTVPTVSGLEKLVRETRLKLESSKDLWNRLPHSMCSELAALASNETVCWNGIAISKYESLSEEQTNHDVPFVVHRPNSLIDKEIFQLHFITNKLRTAYYGMDINWVDTVDSYESSGSGRGRSPDDDNSGQGESSGQGRVTPGDEFSYNGAKNTSTDIVTHPSPYHSSRPRPPDGESCAATMTSSQLLLLTLICTFSCRRYLPIVVQSNL